MLASHSVNGSRASSASTSASHGADYKPAPKLWVKGSGRPAAAEPFSNVILPSPARSLPSGQTCPSPETTDANPSSPISSATPSTSPLAPESTLLGLPDVQPWRSRSPLPPRPNSTRQLRATGEHDTIADTDPYDACVRRLTPSSPTSGRSMMILNATDRKRSAQSADYRRCLDGLPPSSRLRRGQVC